MRLLLVQNRYCSGQPSEEDAAVDNESRLLAERDYPVQGEEQCAPLPTMKCSLKSYRNAVTAAEAT